MEMSEESTTGEGFLTESRCIEIIRRMPKERYGRLMAQLESAIRISRHMTTIANLLEVDVGTFAIAMHILLHGLDTSYPSPEGMPSVSRASYTTTQVAIIGGLIGPDDKNGGLIGIDKNIADKNHDTPQSSEDDEEAQEE